MVLEGKDRENENRVVIHGQHIPAQSSVWVDHVFVFAGHKWNSTNGYCVKHAHVHVSYEWCESLETGRLTSSLKGRMGSVEKKTRIAFNYMYLM